MIQIRRSLDAIDGAAFAAGILAASWLSLRQPSVRRFERDADAATSGRIHDHCGDRATSATGSPTFGHRTKHGPGCTRDIRWSATRARSTSSTAAHREVLAVIEALDSGPTHKSDMSEERCHCERSEASRATCDKKFGERPTVDGYALRSRSPRRFAPAMNASASGSGTMTPIRSRTARRRLGRIDALVLKSDRREDFDAHRHVRIDLATAVASLVRDVRFCYAASSSSALDPRSLAAARCERASDRAASRNGVSGFEAPSLGAWRTCLSLRGVRPCCRASSPPTPTATTREPSGSRRSLISTDGWARHDAGRGLDVVMVTDRSCDRAQ